MKVSGAIFLAILFVLVVSALELGNSNVLESLGPQDQEAAESASGQPVVDAPEEPNCPQAESDFAAMVDASRQCSVDADCTLAQLQCPFECVTSVSATLVDELKQAEASFQASCNRCESECPGNLTKWRAACVRQRCIVLDRSHDELEEATLEHLNRPRP
ncbi:MAG: hypothetical protein QNI96_14705 [Woeseiaceae bacterium]|nr:hypothetical protein [Woeseiaceae bacterium]